MVTEPKPRKSARVRGWIPISTFAYVSAMPKRVKFHEHLVPYEGADRNGKTLPWGVYGTSSVNSMMFAAEASASRAKKVMLVLTAWYDIPGLSDSSALPRTLEESRGFLHLGRVGANLRVEIRDELLDMLKRTRTAAEIANYREMAWDDFVASEPAVVRKWAASKSEVLCVVHPVRQLIDPSRTPVVQIASFKPLPERIGNAEVRFMPDIEVVP